MDLIPTPGQVVSAASNVAHSVLYGGLADLRPMPRSLIYDGYRRELYHYRPDREVTPTGDPVLLVTPLAAPSICFDLRRTCSLVEHLVQAGRPTYLVEYGEVSFADRKLGLEYFIDEAIPAAIKEASEHAGGRPVHVVGWSLGGIFALLTAADRHDLPIASVTAIGAPIDVAQVPLVAPLRPLLNLTDGRGAITMAYRALGGAPKPVVNWAFQLASVQKAVTKPLAVISNLDDRDYLAQLEAVDRFSANMIAYPGRTFGQLYHRFIKGNALQSGSLELSGRTISLADITVPVLVFAGATDGIAPVRSVEALLPLLSGSREVRFEIVPGGHLGMLTGRAARTSTWRVLDEWVDQWSGTSSPALTVVPPAPTAEQPVKKAPAKKAAVKKAAVKKTPATKAVPATKAAATAKAPPAKKTATVKQTAAAKKTTAKKPPAKKAATKAAPASTATIGTNRSRRYGSAGSRSLNG